MVSVSVHSAQSQPRANARQLPEERAEQIAPERPATEPVEEPRSNRSGLASVDRFPVSSSASRDASHRSSGPDGVRRRALIPSRLRWTRTAAQTRHGGFE